MSGHVPRRIPAVLFDIIIMSWEIIVTLVITSGTAIASLVWGIVNFRARRRVESEKAEQEVQATAQSSIKTQSDYLDLAAKFSDLLTEKFKGLDKFNSTHEQMHKALEKKDEETLEIIAKVVKSVDSIKLTMKKYSELIKGLDSKIDKSIKQRELIEKYLNGDFRRYKETHPKPEEQPKETDNQ